MKEKRMVGGKEETNILLTKINLLESQLISQRYTVLTICEVFILLLIII